MGDNLRVVSEGSPGDNHQLSWEQAHREREKQYFAFVVVAFLNNSVLYDSSQNVKKIIEFC